MTLTVQDVSKYANDYNIDPKLILAIIRVESSGNPHAVRFEPEWKFFNEPALWARRLNITEETERTLQMFSWGLMQVMGATSRDLGFQQELHMLANVEIGITYGCKYLRRQLDRYDGNTMSAIAAYNAGSAIKMKENTKIYVNQQYVNKVLDAWNKQCR